MALPRPQHRLARRLAVDRAVVVGELAQVPEPMGQGRRLHGAPGTGPRQQRRPHHAHPAQLEVAVHADAQVGAERLVQRGGRDAQRGAEIPRVDRPRGVRAQVVVRPPHGAVPARGGTAPARRFARLGGLEQIAQAVEQRRPQRPLRLLAAEEARGGQALLGARRECGHSPVRLARGPMDADRPTPSRPGAAAGDEVFAGRGIRADRRADPAAVEGGRERQVGRERRNVLRAGRLAVPERAAAPVERHEPAPPVPRDRADEHHRPRAHDLEGDVAEGDARDRSGEAIGVQRDGRDVEACRRGASIAPAENSRPEYHLSCNLGPIIVVCERIIKDTYPIREAYLQYSSIWSGPSFFAKVSIRSR